MQTAFKSKIGLSILIPLAFLLVTIEVLMIINGIWPAAIFIVLLMLFITYLYIDTSYKLTNDKKLIIKSGFLINKQIEISSIKKVTSTKDPMASPALSLDRLEILYNKFDRILVSPKQKAEFINQLKQLNPTIDFA